MMALCFGFCTLSCTRSILLTAAVVFCCCNGNDSCHEHPQRATSWQRESVRRVMQCPNVQTVIFDQCRVGLKTPDSKQPLCKRTTLLTNSPAIVSSFSPLQCNCQVEYGIIQGVRSWCSMVKILSSVYTRIGGTFGQSRQAAIPRDTINSTKST